jgi:hypothetical protein
VSRSLRRGIGFNIAFNYCSGFRRGFGFAAGIFGNRQVQHFLYFVLRSREKSRNRIGA